MDTNQTEFSVVIGAIDVALAWILLGQLKAISKPTGVADAFLRYGQYLWCRTVIGTTWALPNEFRLARSARLTHQAVGKRAARCGLVQISSTSPRSRAIVWLFTTPVYTGSCAMARGRKLTGMLAQSSRRFWRVLLIGFNEVRYHTLFDVGILKS